jgi:hypothetical protein
VTDAEFYDDLLPRVRERDGRCTECGRTYSDPIARRMQLTAVRRRPFEADSMANLRCVCRKCDREKGLS